ncbi:MAG: hypothetical protein NTX25_24170, partial [Proteobacteria bacterium]|nr:hypothetical protein [Pseudomonadota bacterium]
MTSYQHILPSLIWLIVLQFSCRDEPSIDLMHENSTHYFFDAKQIYQSPPGKTENWQDSIAQSLEGKSPSPSGRMWIAINLTSNASYNYVFISMCRNVVQIFQ